MSGHADGIWLVGETLRMHRARKKHTCKACGATIRVGDRYAYHSMVNSERELWIVKRCMRCEYIYRALCSDLAAGRLMGDYVLQDLSCGHSYEDTHREPMPDHLARVAFMTEDELQQLEFSIVDNERALMASRRNEKELRGWGLFDQAAQHNGRTCELERIVGVS